MKQLFNAILQASSDEPSNNIEKTFDCLTFIAKKSNSSIIFNVFSPVLANYIEYRTTDGGSWNKYNSGTSIQLSNIRRFSTISMYISRF